MQLGVLGFGFFQDGDVGVGVFPQHEEILIGGTGFGGVALHGVCTRESKMGQRTDGFIHNDSAMVEDCLELGSGFAALMPGQIGFSAYIGGL